MSAIDQWDWARYGFGIALLLCNVGVWRGVALEESFVAWERETGKRLLIRSLALEAFFAAALFVVDTVASVNQKFEIVALEKQLALRELSSREVAALEPQ